MDARKHCSEMKLSELLRYKMADYGYESIFQFDAALGLHTHMFRLMQGDFNDVGINTRRVLCKSLDISPDVLDRAIKNEMEG